MKKEIKMKDKKSSSEKKLSESEGLKPKKRKRIVRKGILGRLFG